MLQHHSNDLFGILYDDFLPQAVYVAQVLNPLPDGALHLKDSVLQLLPVAVDLHQPAQVVLAKEVQLAADVVFRLVDQLNVVSTALVPKCCLAGLPVNLNLFFFLDRRETPLFVLASLSGLETQLVLT